jgi:hypothetical protein
MLSHFNLISTCDIATILNLTFKWRKKCLKAKRDLSNLPRVTKIIRCSTPLRNNLKIHTRSFKIQVTFDTLILILKIIQYQHKL